jgi:DNA-binding NtrC family response regulator
MCPARILIMDLLAEPCVRGNCNHLRALIEEAFPNATIQASRAAQIPDTYGREPDLVVLRTSLHLPLTQIVRSLRDTWRVTSAVAVLCHWAHTVAELLESLERGLDDYFCCPIRDIELIPRLRRLLSSPPTVPCIPSSLKLDSLVGESNPFLSAVAKIPRVTNSDATVLITGETGTGKELFARAIHYNGSRRNNPFVPLNCGALPEHLFENELFGHVRGAYTDASQSENGLLTEAEGGTLFLDEVDTLTPSAQTKLLRFLQNCEYRPLGSSKSLAANVRTIGATNTDLRERVKMRQFREDLFHRLNVLTLNVPTLRSRGTDIPVLAKHFLKRYGAQYGRGKMIFSRAALCRLLSYSWPGNVRELESMVHRAVVISSGDVLQPGDLELPIDQELNEIEAGPLQAAKSRVIKEFERSYLSNLLSVSNGNISEAARTAGKDRRALQRLIRKHGLAPVAFRSA